jgi:phosphate transport system protein
MKRHFDEELANLKKDILLMGSLVERAIANSIDALRRLSRRDAEEVIADDKAVDALELKIDEECLDLLALRQPMAYDLRFIVMAMKIATDLERMADLAVDIAERVLDIADEPLLKPLIDVPKLATLSQKMLKLALDAYVGSDADSAWTVIILDADADTLRDNVQRELLEEYMTKDPSVIRRGVALILIARHLERICDHATNIAEDIIYMVKAKVVKHRAGIFKNWLANGAKLLMVAAVCMTLSSCGVLSDIRKDETVESVGSFQLDPVAPNNYWYNGKSYEYNEYAIQITSEPVRARIKWNG